MKKDNCKQTLMGGGGDKSQPLRDERIDSIKFCLIVLVILGHTVELGVEKSDTLSKIALDWVYMFHMPLFVFISGYFSRKKTTKVFFSSSLSLLEPLLFFQILSIGLRSIIKHDITIESILTPWFVLWYLLSLTYWRTILQVIPNKFLKHPKLIICLSFAVGILGGWLPFNRFLSIQRTLAFLPFFVLGYYAQNYKLYLPSKYKFVCFLFLIAIIPIVAFYPEYLGDLKQDVPYTGIYGMTGRIIVYLLSIPMSIAFINTCLNNKIFAKQGKFTMQYYIYHALILSILGMLVNKYSLPTTLIANVVYTVGITSIIFISLYIPFVKELTNPIKLFKSLMQRFTTIRHS
jgi:fucose 4-O-acetylase-like acetyltransferase